MKNLELNKITVGSRVANLNDAFNYCKERGIEGNNFKLAMCYAVKGMGANQSVIASWFNESTDFGNTIKNFITDYYDKFMRAKNGVI